MTTNETVVPSTTHINTQECRSNTETEPNTYKRDQIGDNTTMNQIYTHECML